MSDQIAQNGSWMDFVFTHTHSGLFSSSKRTRVELEEKHTETADPLLQSQISAIVSEALYLEGKSSYGASLCKSSAICLFDLVEPFPSNEPILHLGGSHAEGTKTKWSDSDGMKVLPNVTVYEKPRKEDGFSGNIVEMETKECRPGFTRLALVQCVDDSEDIFSSIVQKVDSLVQRNEGGKQLISSQEFADYFVSLHASKVKDIPTHYRHGPCATVLQDLTEYAIQNLESDVAHALRCDDWPSGAQEWCTRERRYGWPSEETMQCIRQQDCHVVPVGDPTSGFSSDEWRISFLFGERELVWSFNDTQLQCYFILKCLLKLELDNVAPEQLSSYHMKTIMFWQCENKPPSMWVPANLLQRVQSCLTELKEAIRNRQLEHFFDRRRNLLSTKFEVEKEKLAMMEKIDALLSDSINPIMKMIQTKQLQDAWNCSQNIRTFIMIADCMDVPKRKAEADFKSLCDTLQTSYIQLSHQIKYPQIGPLLRNIDTVTSAQPGRLDCKYTDILKHFLETKAGMELAILATKTENDSAKMSMMKDAEDLFQAGSEFNAITGKLYLATFLFHEGKHHAVAAVLGDVMHNVIDKQLYYAGVASSTTGVQVDQMGLIEQGNFSSYSEDSSPVSDAVFDVVIAPEDTAFVPYPLKFECALLTNRTVDIIYLHPVVYFYLLMFFNEMAMGNYFLSVKSLLNLEKTVKGFDHPVRSFRDYNLLGFCYAAMGQYSEAQEIYCQSLKKYPSARNGAVYHMMIMLQFLIHSTR